MNKCWFSGRLTARPELRTTGSGKMVTEFSLAVKRDYKNPDGNYDSDFIDFTVWNQQAETISKWCDKGDELSVAGSLRVRDYTDKNGNKRRKYDVEVSSFEFGRKAGEGTKRNENTPPDQTATKVQNSTIIPGINATPSKQAVNQNVEVTDWQDIGPDEDLPF